jgi:Secretion system C-terminal sorting domain
MKMKSTLVVIAACMLSCMHVFSQAPAKQWDASFGGTDNEQFAAAQQTSDGGYITGGFSESGISGDKTQETQGTSDYWVVKTNADGVKQWDARFGGTSVDELTALQQTADGGYILGGISFSDANGDKSQASQGQSDYWIIKIDANGVKQWDARFGGSSFDELHSLQQTADGGYILGGSSFSGISGDKTQATRGGKDFWIVKTDANGVKQWDARFGGTLFEELFSIRQSTDGGYIMGGYSLSDVDGDKTTKARGKFDYWVVKTTATGIKEWDATFGGTEDDWLTQLSQTTDGGYILGGWSWSGKSGDKSQAVKGDNDYWIIKINNLGVKQWDADYGGSTNDYLNAIQQTTDGGFILGGYSSSLISGDKTQDTKGGTDYWIVKTNANGVKQWDADFGGSDFDFLYAVQQTSDGGYLLGGYSASGISGDKTQDSRGVNDYWIIKLNTAGAACASPANLTTVNIGSEAATLKWNNVVGAISYIAEYKAANASGWITIKASGNVKQLHDLKAKTKYEWRVKTVCSRRPVLVSDWSATQSFTTLGSNMQRVNKPTFDYKNSFVEVYPNPVSHSATVSFSLSKASHTMIEVMDINGRTLKTIANKDFSAGTHTLTFNRELFQPGIYFLRISTSQKVMTQKIVIE